MQCKEPELCSAPVHFAEMRIAVEDRLSGYWILLQLENNIHGHILHRNSIIIITSLCVRKTRESISHTAILTYPIGRVRFLGTATDIHQWDSSVLFFGDKQHVLLFVAGRRFWLLKCQ